MIIAFLVYIRKEVIFNLGILSNLLFNNSHQYAPQAFFILFLIFIVGCLGISVMPSSGEICSPSNGGGAGVGLGSHGQGNENIAPKCP